MSSAAQVSEPAVLARRPEAITLSVEDILAYVRAGRVRVPTFQRGLCWESKDVDLLFDSIYRGYPVGTLLFWKKPAEADVISVGTLRIDAPARQDALWVVDGQQRITTLAAVLTGEYEDLTGTYTLYFDLQRSAFVRADKRHAPAAHWLPLNRVADSAALLTWLHERGHELDKAAVSAAIEVGKRVREYQIPAYVVDTEDEEPLRQIFDRTNSGGKPLAAADVFNALHGGSARSPADLAEVAAALGETGFGDIEQDLLLRAMLAVWGKDPSRGFKGQIADVDVSAALSDTQRALERVIVFLRRHAGIPHLRLMPYRLPLITLARFFQLHPEPAPRSRELLSRWLWRGAVSGRHQGGTVTTRKTLSAIVPDEASAVQNLLGDVGQRPDTPPALTPYKFRGAQSKMQVLALWALRPRHLVTGAHLRIEDIVEAQSPAVQIWSPRAENGLEAAHGLANRLLHPPLPGGLRKPLLAQRDEGVWASHGITAAAHDALRAGDFAAFLALRQDQLSPYIERFLARHAKWEESDRPALTQLVIDDDDTDGDLEVGDAVRAQEEPPQGDNGQLGLGLGISGARGTDSARDPDEDKGR